jgi:hypothetical protein
MAHGEPKIQPDGLPNYVRLKAMTLEGNRLHTDPTRWHHAAGGDRLALA